MRCIALARSTGQRCGNEAEPGAVFCQTPQHRDGAPTVPLEELTPDELEELPAGIQTGPGKPDEPAPAQQPQEPAQEDPGELEIGPADLGAAQPQEPLEVDPDLFRGLELPGDPGPGRGRADELEELPPLPAPAGDLMAANPGPWSPAAVAPVLAVLEARLERDGKPGLSAGERDALAEPLAASLNRILGQVDPNNPYGALVGSVVVVVGSRYAGDVVRKVTGAKRARKARKADERARARDADELEELTDDGAQEDGGAPGWADLIPA